MADAFPSTMNFRCRLCGHYDQRFALAVCALKDFDFARRCKTSTDKKAILAARAHADVFAHGVEWHFQRIELFLEKEVKDYKTDLPDAVAKLVLLREARKLSFPAFKTECPAPVEVHDLHAYTKQVFDRASKSLKRKSMKGSIITGVEHLGLDCSVTAIVAATLPIIDEHKNRMKQAILRNQTVIKTTSHVDLYNQLQDIWAGHRFDYDSLVYRPRTPETRVVGSPYRVGQIQAL